MSPVRRSGSAARPQPEVLRGSLFTLRRRCGTPTCRCADGEGHASPALAYPAGGRTKTLTLTLQEAVEVAAALARYAQAKADLDEQAAAGQSVLPEPVHPVAPVEPAAVEAFAASRELFETALGWFQGREAGGLEH